MRGLIKTNTIYYKTQTFNASDSIQSFIVPSNITYINVDCVASKGHDYGSSGGAGGRIQCKLLVTPGTTLYIVVGNIPSSSSRSYNASDIRTNNNGITDETSLQSRLIVAGGGGSGGYGSVFSGTGGAGGGLIGSNGSERYSSTIISATGGTQNSGGIKGYYASASESEYLKYGENGMFGLGGNSIVASSGNGTTYSGAGGAGWYGGGSGTSRATTRSNQDAGGGAGGSSYTDSNLCSDIIHTQGYNTGSGYITLIYEGTESDYDYAKTTKNVLIYNSQNEYFCSKY